MSEIRVSFEGQVAILTIDNPPSNCLTTAMFRQLGDYVQVINNNDEIRAAVIQGAGPSLYTVGADIREMEVQARLANRKATVLHWLQACNTVVTHIDQARVPFICAMKGISFGAGLEIGAACDIRIAAEESRFAMPEIKLGIIPGYGGTQRLLRLIGTGHALALIVSAQEFDVEVAQRWGLVDIVTAKGESEATALSLARTIAGYGPLALANAKRAIRRGGQGDLAAGLAVEQELFLQCATSADFDEGLHAFLQKRTPRFAGK
jgi:enoyl-CoA hydratase